MKTTIVTQLPVCAGCGQRHAFNVCCDVKAAVNYDPHKNAVTKRVQYSYRTSPHAERFGFKNSGCYTVETVKPGKPGKGVAAFATLEEARAYANGMPQPWNRLTL